MTYEYLLRGIYDCGRDASKGADADIYRAMEHAHNNLSVKVMFKTQDEREYDYRKKFAAVRSNVRDALQRGYDRIKGRLDNKDEGKLASFISTLNFSVYDREELDKIIDESDELFSRYGVKVP